MIAALLLTACASGPESTGVVLTGWHYGWRDLAHRISLLRTELAPDASASLGLVGGDWSNGETATDVPEYRLTHATVTTQHANFAYGSVELLVPPDGEATGEIVVEAASLPERADLRALINGFSIATDVEQADPDYPADYDPAHGYTSTGFGFALGPPERDGDTVRVPVRARAGWGPQDREDMNAAIPHAVTAVSVSTVLVSFDGEATDVPLAARATYTPDNPDASVWSGTEQPPQELPASFTEGPRDGFVGWSAFFLEVNPAGDFAGEGDYLRAFGVEAVNTSSAPRAWDGTVTATLSTTNLIEFTVLTAGFEGTLTRIGVRDADVAYVERSGDHDVGELALTAP